MKKNITILVIILLSHLKNNKIFYDNNKSIIFKNIYLNKNPKNYKKKHSTNLLIRNYFIRNGSKKIPKLLAKIKNFHFIFPLRINNFVKNLLPFNKNNKLDFNVFNLLIYGC
jgi:hypothetical protein